MPKFLEVFMLISISIILIACTQKTGIRKMENKQMAPNFKLLDETGTFRTLEEFKGKKVVLYFYPKNDTPGCTKEACSFRDNSDLYAKNNITVIGISFDSPESHAEFKAKYNLPFILLADTDHKVARDYKADKGVSGYLVPNRVTFLINEQGEIIKTIENVNVSQHAQDILKEFGIK